MNILRGSRLLGHQYICHFSKSSITCREVTLLSVTAGNLTAAAQCWQHSSHCTSHSRSPYQLNGATHLSQPPELLLQSLSLTLAPCNPNEAVMLPRVSCLLQGVKYNGVAGAKNVQPGRIVGPPQLRCSQVWQQVPSAQSCLPLTHKHHPHNSSSPIPGTF